MRILLVEDDCSLADGLQTALRREGFAIDHVSNGADALTAIRSNEPELLILDLGLPDMDGMDILSHLRTGDKAPLVIVLTARDTVEDKVAGLDHGADDYLAKPFEIPELLARLRALERRITATQTTQIRIGPVVLDTLTHTVIVDDKTIDLPRREFMLLKALLENPGQVFSREHLESKLYSWGEELASNSIEVHIHHLRKKIPAEFIKTIRGVGYTIPHT